MKAKLLNLGLILSSFIGYLEWGADQSNMLILMEWELIKLFVTDPLSALHPFTIIPMLGQILLLITLFQKTPDRLLTYLGLGFLSLLLLMVLLVGFLAMNFMIIASALPFVVIGVLTLMHLRKMKPEKSAAPN